MQREFWTEVLESGFIHKPLPLHNERSLEAYIGKKAVKERRVIWKDGTLAGVSGSGSATVGLAEGAGADGKAALYMEAPFRSETWPDGILFTMVSATKHSSLADIIILAQVRCDL